MFEELKNCLNARDYMGAAALLSPLGEILHKKPYKPPQGFSDAEIRVMSVEGTLHIFAVMGSLSDFWAVPGDFTECEQQGGVKLMSKVVQLGPIWDHSHPHGICLHFLHLFDTAKEYLDA